jgi:hypothetical protein
MNRLGAKVFRIEGLEKILIIGLPFLRWKGHAKALVDVIEVAEPETTGTGPVRVVAHVN